MVDWKYASHKLVKASIAVIIAGLAASYGNSQWYLGIAPILLWLENVVTHWADGDVPAQ